MEHTNLFLYENDAALQVDYPNGKVDDVVPGVAYARAAGDEDPTVIYNDKITVYTVTLNLKNRSGATIGTAESVQTPEAVEGAYIKVNIVAPDVEGYKPAIPVEKIEISANTSHDVIYNAATAYTVTVHHMCEGSAITADTTVVSDTVYETEKVKVTIVPENVSGYTAQPVTISVSGDMAYNLEYEYVPCTTYEFVDLGLDSGTLWATCNVGADNPWETGNYYAWGEVEPKSNYTMNTYKWYNPATDSLTKYSGSTLSPYTLEDEDDVAHVSSCNPDVYMPSYNEIYELVNDCYLTRETVNGVGVAKFTGPNNNYIIMPLSPFKSGTTFEELSRYWGAQGVNASGAGLGFCDEGTYVSADGDIGPVECGYLVRPVIPGNDGGFTPESVNPSETKLANASEPIKRKLFKRFANVPAEEPKDEK